MKKGNWITFTVIVAVLILAIIILSQPNPPTTSEEVAKCIGENSVLYSRLGCHFCDIQEEMFGEHYQYLTVVDCFYTNDLCVEKGIEGTPTWEIDGELYVGVQEIDKLTDLTGCVLI